MKLCEWHKKKVTNDDLKYECWNCGLKFCLECVVDEKQTWSYQNKSPARGQMNEIGYCQCPRCHERVAKFYRGQMLTMQDLLNDLAGKKSDCIGIL